MIQYSLLLAFYPNKQLLPFIKNLILLITTTLGGVFLTCMLIKQTNLHTTTIPHNKQILKARISNRTSLSPKEESEQKILIHILLPPSKVTGIFHYLKDQKILQAIHIFK